MQAPAIGCWTTCGVDVDREAKTVTAGLLGIFGKGMAVARDGFGCTSVPDGKARGRAAGAGPGSRAARRPMRVWPEGDSVEPSQDPGIAAILDDGKLTGPGMRAVVVVENGRIVGERYGEGFSPETPLLGWSMTKIGDRRDHRHAGQGRQDGDRPASNCSSRGRPTAAPRSASPT